jgi:hypothetical protein
MYRPLILGAAILAGVLGGVPGSETVAPPKAGAAAMSTWTEAIYVSQPVGRSWSRLRLVEYWTFSGNPTDMANFQRWVRNKMDAFQRQYPQYRFRLWEQPGRVIPPTYW